MNRKKRLLALLTAIGLLSVTVVGCSGSNEESSGKTDKKSDKEITLMIPEWGVPSEELLEEFEEETGINVDVEAVAWDDIRDKVSIAAAGGKAPADVIEVDWSWVGEFDSADWLEPIEISEEDIEAMPSIQSFMVGDKVLALPYANDYRIAYYNTEHYKEAGIENAPKTWDEVYQNAKLLKEKKVVDYPFSIPLSAEESSTTALIWLTFAREGKVFNDDNTLNKDAVLSTLEYMDKMNKEGLLDPSNRTSSGMDSYRKLTSGEASFMVGPTSFVGRVNDEEESDVVGEVSPILVPGKDNTAKQTFALPEGVGVSKYSENKDEAMEFVKWYNSEKIQESLYDELNVIPTRTSVLEKLIEDEKIENTGAMLEESKLIKSPFPNGVPKYYSEMSKAIFDAINKMAIDQSSPEEAFNEMDSKVKELAK
ncbi:MAG: sugar ABC transporter substrate-binding protein [Andreesenia angusta]|nr:sugar ABC transporter substrate-binding protein [Andreesenia angusta]